MKTFALALACFALPVSASAAVIRTLDGIRYQVPAGWELTEFDGNTATIRHAATVSAETKKSPNQFQLRRQVGPYENVDIQWDRLDVDEKRELPNGAAARWRAGTKWGYHFVFSGEALLGGKGVAINILDSITAPALDVKVVEAGLLGVAETLAVVPASETFYHPTKGFSATAFGPRWWESVEGAFLGYQCSTGDKEGDCGKGSYTMIYAYRAPQFKDAAAALADIKAHYDKTEGGGKPVKTQRAEIPDGEVLWIERDDLHPMIGAVRRGKSVFWVSLGVKTAGKELNASLREGFLAVAKSLRDWDGQ